MSTLEDQSLATARTQTPLPVLGVFPRRPLRWTPFADRQRTLFAALAAADAALSPPNLAKTNRLAAMLAALEARATATRGSRGTGSRASMLLQRMGGTEPAPIRITVGNDSALCDVDVSIPADGADLVVRVLAFA